jgi:hypothetical protein
MDMIQDVMNERSREESARILEQLEAVRSQSTEAAQQVAPPAVATQTRSILEQLNLVQGRLVKA